jgi:acyl-CoA thioester hydrolase
MSLCIMTLPVTAESSYMPAECAAPTFTNDFMVRYAETDAMGVVHHANYLVYFEEGRSHYMRTLGADYAEFEAAGYQLPVTETGLRYAGSLRYGSRVCVSTRVLESKSRSLHFTYEVSVLGHPEVLVTGFTKHVWTDLDGKVCRAPAKWGILLQNFSDTTATV